nr:hypothetical protein L321_07422 [Pseudomonas plecoglossicida NB2011]
MQAPKLARKTIRKVATVSVDQGSTNGTDKDQLVIDGEQDNQEAARFAVGAGLPAMRPERVEDS